MGCWVVLDSHRLILKSEKKVANPSRDKGHIHNLPSRRHAQIPPLKIIKMEMNPGINFRPDHEPGLPPAMTQPAHIPGQMRLSWQLAGIGGGGDPVYFVFFWEHVLAV